MTDHKNSGNDATQVVRRRGSQPRGELPAVDDAGGIPTFVFRDNIGDVEKPSSDSRTLEVMLLWQDTLLKVGHFMPPQSVTVGADAKCSFPLSSDKLSGQHTLISPQGSEFVVNWTDNMTLEVRGEKGEVLDQEALEKRHELKSSASGKQYRIGLHDRVAVQTGEVTFVLQYVSPPKVVPGTLLQALDVYFTKVLSLSFMTAAFFIFLIRLTFLDPTGLSEDLFKNPNRFAKLVLTAPDKQPQKKKFDLEGKDGAKHKDKEGKFGKLDKKKDALASTKGAPRVDPNKREKDRKIALNSGLFSALQGKDGAVSSVFGPGGLGTGINQALGGLRGTAMGDAGGAGGLGTRGSGPGGGGNSLGIGGLGSGSGYGSGGSGNVDLGGRGSGRYQVVPGRTITKGCLTEQQVGRVLSRVHNQARYCYEKELTRDPNLAGKVTTFFIIGSTGSVTKSSIAQSTMNDSAVEACLLRVIERLKFPPCAGGGTAEVTYPWLFSSGGGK